MIYPESVLPCRRDNAGWKTLAVQAPHKLLKAPSMVQGKERRTLKVRTSNCVIDPVIWDTVLTFEVEDTLKR